MHKLRSCFEIINADMKRPGNILAFALIITLSFLTAGIGIGMAVLDGARNARAETNASNASYLAESGIERQLFEIRKNNQDASYIQSLATTTYPNGSFWVSTGALENINFKQFPSLSTSTVAAIDLFDPDALSTPPGITEVDVQWTKASGCSVSNSSVEASYAFWKVVNGVPTIPSDQPYVILPRQAADPLTNAGLIQIVGLDPNSAYRIQLRAFNCPVINVQATALTNTGSHAFPGDVTLSAEGTYASTTVKMAATIPKQQVLSGLFNYVLFTECTLVKGLGPQSCP